MSASFTLNAQSRTLEGKGASRRLRRLEARIPAVIYGGTEPAQSISVELRELVKALENEAFFSHVLTLTIDGTDQPAILKSLQRHPAKNTPLHADFLRVDVNEKLTKRVPLHFINAEACVGVKTGGGAVSQMANDVEIRCLPGNLPGYIEVDLLNMNVGDTLHLSDLKLPEGVEIPALALGRDHDHAVANVHATKGEE